MYTLAMYYVIKTPLEENPLLYNFVNGDDAYRNSRFKLIPYISKVSINSDVEYDFTNLNKNLLSFEPGTSVVCCIHIFTYACARI